jgi:hypothetical protein
MKVKCIKTIDIFMVLQEYDFEKTIDNKYLSYYYDITTTFTEEEFDRHFITDDKLREEYNEILKVRIKKSNKFRIDLVISTYEKDINQGIELNEYDNELLQLAYNRRIELRNNKINQII